MVKKKIEEFSKKNNVYLVAISEPFMEEARMSSLSNFLNFPDCCSNEVEGGKLWILWRVPNAFEILCCLAQMITSWFELNVLNLKEEFYGGN